VRPLHVAPQPPRAMQWHRRPGSRVVPRTHPRTRLDSRTAAARDVSDTGG
jgi:hypothetical protein